MGVWSVRGRALGLYGGMLCGAAQAWSEPLVLLRPLEARELSLEGGQIRSLQISTSDLTSHGPWILLVRQFDLDIELACGGGPFHSAPTGRIGFDFAVIEGPTVCRIQPKMSQARPGRVTVVLESTQRRPLGADLALWKRLLTAHLQGNSQPQQDAAIAALEDIEDTTASGEFVLSAVYARGKLRMRRSLSRDGLADLRLAARLAEEHGLRHFLPAIHNGAGLTLLKTHDLAEAERAFQWAEQLAAPLEQGYEHASALNNQGLVNQHRGDLRNAARYYVAAIEAYQAAGEIEHVAVAMMNHATVAAQLGQVRLARDALQQVIDMRRQGPNQRSLALALQNNGQLSARIGDWPAALASTLEAQELHESLGQPADLIGIYLIRSQLYLSLGQIERSRHYARLAEAQLVPSVAKLLKPGVQSMLAKVADSAAATMALHRSAASAMRDNRRHADAAAELIDLAEVAAGLGDWTTAQQALADTRLDILRSPQRLRARHHLVTARLLVAEGKADQAAPILDEAAEIFSRLRDYSGVYLTTLTQAQATLRTASADESLRLLATAIDAQDHLLASAPTPNLAASLRTAQRPWKDIAIELALSHPDDGEQLRALITLLNRWYQPAAVASLPNDLLEEYRYKISALSNDDLSERLRSELMAELEALESRIEAQGRLQLPVRGTTEHPRAAVSETPAVIAHYLIGSDRSLLLVEQGKDVWTEALPGRAALAERLAEGLATPWAFKELARLLYPTRLREAGIPLAIVADERLHDAPLAALWQSVADPRTAIPVVSASGALIASRLQSPGPSLRVASLLPTGIDSPQLPGVGIERSALAELLGHRFLPIAMGSEPLLDLPDAEIIHVAGHGWVSRERPMANAISDLPFGSTADSPLVDPARLQPRLKPRLIVLSACEGAGSDAYGSGYSLALSYAQHFDAPVVAPTEPIDDGDAATFTRVLFERLQSEDIRTAFDAALASTQGTNLRHYAPWQLIIP